MEDGANNALTTGAEVSGLTSWPSPLVGSSVDTSAAASLGALVGASVLDTDDTDGGLPVDGIFVTKRSVGALALGLVADGIGAFIGEGVV
jgi:hypothetical protein